MAELAIGLVGLAGLFSTCVDSFKLIQIWNSRGQDFDTYQTMLDNQLFGLMTWGRACGFMDAHASHDGFEDTFETTRSQRIYETLVCIRDHVHNSEKLRRKYGMREVRPTRDMLLMDRRPNPSPFKRAFQNTRSFWNTVLQRQSRFNDSIYWTVSDKEKFEVFVGELRVLIEDLERLTAHMHLASHQRMIADYEMAFIDDEPSLEAIADASAACDGDDMVSSAARRRLAQVEERSVHVKALQPDDSVSVFSRATHQPGSRDSVVDTVVQDDESANDDQAVGIHWVSDDKWRNVKTRQGILPYLPTLIASRCPPTQGATRDEFESDSTPLNGDTSPESVQSGRQNVTRLAINSKTLIDKVRELTGLPLTARHNVLVYPFKALILHEHAIRSAMAVLKETAATTEPTDTPALLQSEELEPLNGAISDEAASEARNKRLATELACLVGFMDDEVMPTLPSCDAFDSSMVSFDQLWQLFFKTEILLDDTREQAYVLLTTQGGRKVWDTENYSRSRYTETAETEVESDSGTVTMVTDFVIWCARQDCDGSRVGPVLTEFTIRYFPDKRPLSALPCLPLNTLKDRSEVEARLASRGSAFMRAMNLGQFAYCGPPRDEFSMDHKVECLRCQRQQRLDDLDGSLVVIDHSVALDRLVQEGCTWRIHLEDLRQWKPARDDKRDVFDPIACDDPACRRCTDVLNDDSLVGLSRKKMSRFTSFAVVSLREYARTSDDQRPVPLGVVLLPPMACGYSLRFHTWLPLTVANLATVQSKEHVYEPFKNVVLDPKAKTRLESFVRPRMHSRAGTKHGRPSPLAKRTSVLLFHGMSGTGKTLAAQAVSSACNLSLMSIGPTELDLSGSNPKDKLARMLFLARRWHFAIEIENADTILHRRSVYEKSGSPDLTPALFQELDRFDGLIILSTSAIARVAEDMMTRVDLAINFPKISDSNAAAILRLHLRRLGAEDGGWLNEHGLIGVHGLTGREAGNLIQAAWLAASTDMGGSPTNTRGGPVMIRASHFRDAVEAKRAHEEWMDMLHSSPLKFSRRREDGTDAAADGDD